jgi:hypothetical protein
MRLAAVFTVSAVYLAVLGVGFMFFPRQIGVEAVPPDAPAALIAYLRIFGGPCLGVAVLNWRVRKAEPSAIRDTVVVANIVGFGCVAAMDVWGVASGDARPAMRLFLVVHLLMTFAFVVAGRSGARRPRSGRAP